jgi:hypothetical protein
MLLIFKALPIQVKPNYVTNLKMYNNLMSSLQCLVLGMCLQKDVMDSTMNLGKFLHKNKFFFLLSLVGCMES